MNDADISHLSIGEVLSLLQDEFPDVTISKIRFLESQGLIDPERTPSGYRKFYESDVERLRWILQQQRDHFLPLKVIKDRLLEADRANMALDFSPPPEITEQAPVEPEPEPEPEFEPASEPVAASRAPRADPMGSLLDLADDPAPEPEQIAAPEPAPAPATDHAPAPAPHEVDPAEAEPAVGPESVTIGATSTANPMDLGPTEMTLTADELSRMSGLSLETIEELHGAGLLATRLVGADRFFDSDSVVVARAAAKFAEFGVETRHLRMYKVSSEREAGFFEQIIMPLLKQRNPTARQRAIEQVATMAGLGQQLHAALLRQALDDSLG